MRVDEMDEATVGRALYFDIFSAKQKVIGGKKDAPLSSPLNRMYLATNIRKGDLWIVFRTFSVPPGCKVNPFFRL